MRARTPPRAAGQGEPRATPRRSPRKRCGQAAGPRPWDEARRRLTAGDPRPLGRRPAQPHAYAAPHIEGSVNIVDELFEELVRGGLPFARRTPVLLACPVGEVTALRRPADPHGPPRREAWPAESSPGGTRAPRWCANERGTWQRELREQFPIVTAHPSRPTSTARRRPRSRAPCWRPSRPTSRRRTPTRAAAPTPGPTAPRSWWKAPGTGSRSSSAIPEPDHSTVHFTSGTTEGLRTVARDWLRAVPRRRRRDPRAVRRPPGQPGPVGRSAAAAGRPRHPRAPARPCRTRRSRATTTTVSSATSSVRGPASWPPRTSITSTAVT